MSEHTNREQDTREQLEAWAHEEIAEKWAQSDREVTMIMDDLHDLLDRQAAITERELCSRCSPYATAKDYLDTIDELTAERDQYKQNAKILADKAQQYRDERDKYEVLAVNAELWKDERDELQAAIDAMGNGQFYAMYRQACEERDALRERLEAITAAQHDKPGT